jgi:hypothetical protein
MAADREVKAMTPHQPTPPSNPLPAVRQVRSKRTRLVIPSAVVAVALGIVLVATAATGDDAPRRQTASPPASAPHGTGPVSRCIDAPVALVKRVEQGLTLPAGGRLRAVKAVKSKEFTYLYVIAADIQSPGLDGRNDIGVWSTNSLQSDAPLIFAVNHLARRSSNWGSPGQDADISGTTHGVAEARDCVVQTLRSGTQRARGEIGHTRN